MNDHQSAPAKTLWIAGYGAWTTAVRADRLVAALVERHVTRLVDVRLNPSAAGIKPGPYGPKPWTLQAGRSGIVGLLDAAGIIYEWFVELGNPQRHDPLMAVLRSQLADPEGHWPVHRGLNQLATLVAQPDEVIALLCACADYRSCHRTLIAQALSARAFDSRLVIKDVRSGDQVIPEAAG